MVNGDENIQGRQLNLRYKDASSRVKTAKDDTIASKLQARNMKAKIQHLFSLRVKKIKTSQLHPLQRKKVHDPINYNTHTIH